MEKEAQGKQKVSGQTDNLAIKEVPKPQRSNS